LSMIKPEKMPETNTLDYCVSDDDEQVFKTVTTRWRNFTIFFTQSKT